MLQPSYLHVADLVLNMFYRCVDLFILYVRCDLNKTNYSYLLQLVQQIQRGSYCLTGLQQSLLAGQHTTKEHKSLCRRLYPTGFYPEMKANLNIAWSIVSTFGVEVCRTYSHLHEHTTCKCCVEELITSCIQMSSELRIMCTNNSGHSMVLSNLYYVTRVSSIQREIEGGKKERGGEVMGRMRGRVRDGERGESEGEKESRGLGEKLGGRGGGKKIGQLKGARAGGREGV